VEKKGASRRSWELEKKKQVHLAGENFELFSPQTKIKPSQKIGKGGREKTVDGGDTTL